MANFWENRYSFYTGFFTSVICFLLFLLFILPEPIYSQRIYPMPTFDQLNQGIIKAENYYNGLYRPLNKSMAVMIEYYMTNKADYTVRHGVIGGYYYYKYIGDVDKSTKLQNLITTYGFIPSFDDHSFIWTQTNNAPLGIVYSLKDYNDCFVSLPSSRTIFPYHSKVCKLGKLGMQLYFLFSHFDTLSPIETTLQAQEQGYKVNTSSFEKKFDTLGFGMPICTPLGCGTMASTIRTAQFGVLEMRTGHMQYADAVASSLLAAQDKQGAIYISYDKNGHYKNEQSIFYKLIDLFFNDKPIYKGFIPSNAETMNDVLAFLLQYRQARLNECLAVSYEK